MWLDITRHHQVAKSVTSITRNSQDACTGTAKQIPRMMGVEVCSVGCGCMRKSGGTSWWRCIIYLSDNVRIRTFFCVMRVACFCLSLMKRFEHFSVRFKKSADDMYLTARSLLGGVWSARRKETSIVGVSCFGSFFRLQVDFCFHGRSPRTVGRNRFPHSPPMHSVPNLKSGHSLMSREGR
jgi:hypothetical protein